MQDAEQGQEWHYWPRNDARSIARNRDGLRLDFANHNAAILGKAVLEADHAASAELEGRIRKLERALQALYDVQNGPPLIRDSEQWEAAMTQAAALLHPQGADTAAEAG